MVFLSPVASLYHFSLVTSCTSDCCEGVWYQGSQHTDQHYPTIPQCRCWSSTRLSSSFRITLSCLFKSQHGLWYRVGNSLWTGWAIILYLTSNQLCCNSIGLFLHIWLCVNCHLNQMSPHHWHVLHVLFCSVIWIHLLMYCGWKGMHNNSLSVSCLTHTYLCVPGRVYMCIVLYSMHGLCIVCSDLSADVVLWRWCSVCCST